MSKSLPDSVDTIIVGNGPSALILSYILHGHIPFYDPLNPHPDPILHQKLKSAPCLLSADFDFLTDHFSGSRCSYSTQALPGNALLDALIRPYGETDDTSEVTCIRWEYRPERAVRHVVVGNTREAGGQWADNPVEASWDIETLSYGKMLSLPGYSFSDHYWQYTGQPLQPFIRPTRREVASYLAAYPRSAGIEDVVYCGLKLDAISRTAEGFYIGSHHISCKHLVLATGIFSQLIPPRPLLLPLTSLPRSSTRSSTAPLLVIGSGFSAADVIISTPPDRKIIHIYKWAPNTSPSPLRACHQQAYPEYAGVYRRMKLAASSQMRRKTSRPRVQRAPSSAFELDRDWEDVYEGLPNTAIIDVTVRDDLGTITCQSGDDPPFQRTVSGLAYVVGRRGSLSFLVPHLQSEVCGTTVDVQLLSGQTLREKALKCTEVAENIFITGSMTGDSLIRFAYGGCVYAAGRIISRQGKDCGGFSPIVTNQSGKSSPGRTCAMNGLDGHHVRPILKDAHSH